MLSDAPCRRSLHCQQPGRLTFVSWCDERNCSVTRTYGFVCIGLNGLKSTRLCNGRRLLDFDVHDKQGTEQPLEGSDLKAQPLFLTGDHFCQLLHGVASFHSCTNVL